MVHRTNNNMRTVVNPFRNDDILLSIFSYLITPSVQGKRTVVDRSLAETLGNVHPKWKQLVAYRLWCDAQFANYTQSTVSIYDIPSEVFELPIRNFEFDESRPVVHVTPVCSTHRFTIWNNLLGLAYSKQQHQQQQHQQRDTLPDLKV
eukprot:GEZU01034268.1.p1 GENE.GEZU01034268.1~~GEZU01034268.1.p1  ORF type:complete len:148 (+),score=22.70 GEZU01034268.1:71-514(+)